MDFRVAERLQLLNVLAKYEGNLTTLRIVRDLQSALGFDESELAALKFEQGENFMRWDPAADVVKAVEIGAAARGVIVSAFQKIEKRDQLTLELLPLYERFLT
jgi:hypothetical protein